MRRWQRFPELGDRVPRRGNWLTRTVARCVMGLLGWRIDGDFPNLGKGIFIVVPHTSNWDFMVGVGALYALGFRAGFLGKHTLFRWPLGPIMRFLGGIPIDRRSSRGGAVAQVAERFQTSDKLLLGISPEGTRKRVIRWKTGFYYIAVEAGVPIIPAAFDYAGKSIRLGEPLTPTGNIAADMIVLKEFFDGVVGKRDIRIPELQESETAEACAQI